jgi:hypothetical protein
MPTAKVLELFVFVIRWAIGGSHDPCDGEFGSVHNADPRRKILPRTSLTDQERVGRAIANVGKTDSTAERKHTVKLATRARFCDD